MKIKRFTAANMQAGLKTISETLGPEAVILSNRRLSDGLEIVAGVDEREYEPYQATNPDDGSDSDIIKASPELSKPLDQETMQQLFSAMADKNKQAFAEVDTRSAPLENVDQRQSAPRSMVVQESSRPVATFESKSPTVRAEQVIEQTDHSAISMLRQEIDGLKDLLKEQTEQLKEPAKTAEMSPQYERLESRLETLGFSNSLIRKILVNYDREDSIERNWRNIMGRVSSALPAPLYEPLSTGGVFALSGPTGAGKTTTIAKLAAHAVKDHGIDSVAVISLDWFQVGGQEILRSVTDILGIQFKALSEKDDLAATLKALSSKRLVLIDTSGSAEALKHWNALMARADLAKIVQTILVLPATTLPSAVNQFIQQHRVAAFVGVILSKLDESACFGGVLEPVMKHRWPLWYCTTGQNIPQDIEVADARKITKRLVQSLKVEKTTLATAS